jgi:hypothetical protein
MRWLEAAGLDPGVKAVPLTAVYGQTMSQKS